MSASLIDPSVIPASVVEALGAVPHEEDRLQRAYEAGRASAFDQVNNHVLGQRERFQNAREYEFMVRQGIGIG